MRKTHTRIPLVKGLKVIEIPWEQPKDVYTSADVPEVFEMADVEFAVLEIGECPFTARKKYRVCCRHKKCEGAVVHPESATPEGWIKGHLREVHKKDIQLVWPDGSLR